ncbi:MAG: methyltransferase domain-containing protein, partial [Candidatus Aenigmarchaeota archaeon]|nr:methyltransferase domain-containing protein [Candidatus Aenigmarchaeota archaeon]
YAVDDLNKAKVKILNQGSGPGRDTYEVAAEERNTPYGEAMDVTLFDIKQDALDIGEKRTRELGVHDKFNFVQGDLRDYLKSKDNEENDIIVCVGILCSLDGKHKFYVIKKDKNHLSDTGCLITASSSEKMIGDDPYLDHWRAVQGFWPLKYTTEKRLRWTYRLAGYNGKLYTATEDPWNHYVIIRGYAKK